MRFAHGAACLGIILAAIDVVAASVITSTTESLLSTWQWNQRAKRGVNKNLALAGFHGRKASETSAKWRSACLRRRKRHHVINRKLDADLLPDLVIVMRWYEGEHVAA